MLRWTELQEVSANSKWETQLGQARQSDEKVFCEEADEPLHSMQAKCPCREAGLESNAVASGLPCGTGNEDRKVPRLHFAPASIESKTA